MNNSKIQFVQAVALHRHSNKVLIFGIVLCLFAYVYFANSAVRSVTLLEEVKSDVDSLRARVSELESKNLTLVNQISMERASQVGLHQAQDPVFLVKGDRGVAISFNR